MPALSWHACWQAGRCACCDRHTHRQRSRRLTVQIDGQMDGRAGRQAGRQMCCLEQINGIWQNDRQQAGSVAYMEGDQDLEECCHVSKGLGPWRTAQAVCQVGAHIIAIRPVACVNACSSVHANECLHNSVCTLVPSGSCMQLSACISAMIMDQLGKLIKRTT